MRPLRIPLAFLIVGSVLVGPVPAQAPRAHCGAAADLDEGEHETVINSVRLWYRVAGAGAAELPPVVFLHGGPGQGSHHFAALAGPYLEPLVRIVYFDQRGSGRSERPWTGDYAMATLVEDVEGLRSELGVERVVLVGHSFGGTLALEYAATHPERVAGIVFVAGLWDTPLQTRLRCARTAALFPEVATRAAGDTAAAAQDEQCNWFWQLPGEEREAINNALMFPDTVVRARLAATEAASGLRNTGELSAALFRAGLLEYRFAQPDRLHMPVLVIAGREDGAAVADGLRELARLLPNAEFREYQASGHFAYLDEPERFARDLAAFVAASAAAALPR